MAVRKLKNGKWAADVTFGVKWDGSRDRRITEHTTQKQAQKAERAMLIERDGSNGISGRITFSEFLDEIYWPQKQGLRRNTRRCYERDIKLRLMPTFGNMNIDQINRLSIQKMLSRCATRKIATNARETLSSILGVAVEMDMLVKNPASYRYQYPAQPEAPDDKFGVWLTSFAEHRTLLDYLVFVHDGEAIERMVALGLCFGLRKGEVFGLDWEDVDFKRSEIHIRHTYTVAKGGAYLTEPKTAKSRRTIPVTSYALERMQSWGEKCGPIVKGLDGERMHPNTASNAMRRLVRETYPSGDQLPRVTLMSLRHSFATTCIRSGIDVATVSAWLGHKDITTTYNRYVKPLLSDLHADARMIDAAFFKT